MIKWNIKRKNNKINKHKTTRTDEIRYSLCFTRDALYISISVVSSPQQTCIITIIHLVKSQHFSFIDTFWHNTLKKFKCVPHTSLCFVHHKPDTIILKKKIRKHFHHIFYDF